MPIKRSTGERKTWKEFFAEWKQGMERVSPLQQAIVSLWGIVISLIGIIWGIIFSIRIGYWWMSVILVGGLIVGGVQFLGTWQRKKILQRMDDVYNTAEREEKKDGEM